MTEPIWLTLDEAATLLKRSRATVLRWLHRKTNRLPSSLRRVDAKKKGVRMVKKSDALAYVPPQMGGAR